MSEELSIFQLLILYFSDKQEGVDNKELSRKIGIEVKRKHLETLLKFGFLEKVVKVGKRGKPLKNYLYRTSQKGKEQYSKYLNEQIKSFLIRTKLSELLVRYRDTVTQIESSLKSFEDALSSTAKIETRGLEEKSFTSLLESAYDELVQRSPVAPMVRISDLRKYVIDKTGILKEEFDNELSLLSEKDPYKFQLFTGIGSEEEGLKTRKGICHYVIIKK